MSETTHGSTYVLGHADEFAPRFRQEALAVDALITMPPLITAWAQVRQ